MAKFREKELTQNLKEFETKTKVELELEKGIEGVVKLEDATIRFDSKKGYIYIESKGSSFRINTTLVFGYEKLEDEIDIELEDILLKIRKEK